MKVDGCGDCSISPYSLFPTHHFISEGKEVYWGICLFWRCGGEIGCYMDEHLEVDKVSVIVTKEGRQTRQA